MKKLIHVVLLMSLLLCACGTAEDMPQQIGKPLDRETAATQLLPNTQETETAPEVTDAPNTPSTPDNPDAPPPEADNVFVSDNNIVFEENALTVRPKYVYWNEGKLVAECFVINGFYTTASNIKINSLTFANADSNLADATFGQLNNVTISPRSYLVWIFVFEENVVSNVGADLSFLRCGYDTTCTH